MMKSKFFLLTKVNFLNSFDIKSLKRNKAKTISTAAYVLLLGLLFVAMSTGYSILFGKMALEFGESIIQSTLFMAGLATMIILSTSFTSVNQVFAGKDYEMLQSMPLTQSEIVGSKLVSVYLFELVFSVVLMLPNAIVNVVLVNSVVNFVVPFVIMFLIPVVPLAIGSILSIVVSVLAGKGKLSSIISTILYVVFFGGFMVVGMMMGNKPNVTSMTSALSWFNPALKLFDLHLSVYACLGIFVGANALLLVIIMTILSLSFNYIHTMISSKSSTAKYVRKEIKNKTELKALFINDMKRVFGSNTLIVQYVVGPLVSAGILVFIALTSFDPSVMTEEVRQFLLAYAPLIMLAPAMMVTIAVPSSTLLSLDGKQMWFIKSSPISPNKLLLSKFLVSVIIILPCYIAASVGVVIAFKMPIDIFLLCGLIGLLYVIFVNLLGLVSNLRHPKFKFENETKLIKQSSTVLIMMGLDFGFTLVLGVVGFFLISLNWNLAVVVMIFLLVVASLGLVKYITAKSEKIFNNFEEF